jgi:hypothetical protein
VSEIAIFALNPRFKIQRGRCSWENSKSTMQDPKPLCFTSPYSRQANVELGRGAIEARAEAMLIPMLEKYEIVLIDDPDMRFLWQDTLFRSS